MCLTEPHQNLRYPSILILFYLYSFIKEINDFIKGSSNVWIRYSSFINIACIKTLEDTELIYDKKFQCHWLDICSILISIISIEIYSLNIYSPKTNESYKRLVEFSVRMKFFFMNCHDFCSKHNFNNLVNITNSAKSYYIHTSC